MNFKLVFNNSGDEILLETKYNSDLLEFFVNKANNENCNSFIDGTNTANLSANISTDLDPLLTHIHWSLSKTNEILYDLIGQNFPENDNKSNYFDQKFLNKQHELWVFSQKDNIIDIDELRYSENSRSSALGWKLHELYPDEIRKIRLAEAMTKLGYIFPYEEVNLAVHRLEGFFTKNIEFRSNKKWDVFQNPYYDSFISNNDIVNFSFGYTYVGRQYYDKWHFFDTNLECKDHYNYEELEFAFQFNLDRPQTIPFSKEFLLWCESKGVNPIAAQIPIGNVIDLEKNLQKYRTMLYNNSRNNNNVKIIIE